MNFENALADLERRGIMPLRAPTLDNTQKALSRLQLQYPTDLRRVIMVAGTNGKGSTAKTLETLLRSAGLRTGMYSSPHLVDYRERILLNGEMISRDDFVRAWSVIRDSTVDIPLSHFEMLTVMAAWMFFSGEPHPPVDVAVFEVGLGGLWDATNAVPHGTALIAQLGMDHQEILGSTLYEIARNKFGIVSPHCLVIHQPLAPELASLKVEIQLTTKSIWHEAPPFEFEVKIDSGLPKFYLASRWGTAPISLPGHRGAQNMNLALAAFAALGFAPEKSLACLDQVEWPGRMQRLTEPAWLAQSGCPVYVSGDHNPQGIESLLEILQHFHWRELRLVVGVGIKKELDEMLSRLMTLPRTRLWLTRAEFQGRDETQYGVWRTRAEDYRENPVEALKLALVDAKPNDLCLVTGSLYLAGDLLRKLNDE